MIVLLDFLFPSRFCCEYLCLMLKLPANSGNVESSLVVGLACFLNSFRCFCCPSWLVFILAIVNMLKQ